jgi:hypothetical protein
VILVPDEPDLEEMREGLETAAAKSGAQFFHFRDFIINIERDVRVNLELPFSRTVVDELRKIITVFVEHISEDLSAAPGTLERPVTAPPKLKKLQETGEDMLSDLSLYAELADHYFDETVHSARLSRTTTEASADITTIGRPAKDLQKRIVKYLNGLNGAITDSYGPGEEPS